MAKFVLQCVNSMPIQLLLLKPPYNGHLYTTVTKCCPKVVGLYHYLIIIIIMVAHFIFVSIIVDGPVLPLIEEAGDDPPPPPPPPPATREQGMSCRNP